MSSYVPLLLLLVALVFKTVRACGGLFCENARPVIQRGEAIVFGVKGNTVEMHVQILYEGPADAFSWILPIPYQPQVDVGSDVLFSALFQQTMPSFQLDIRNQESATCSNEALISNCFSKNNTMAFPEDAEMDTTEDGAIVLEMGSVGPYDFVILEAAENDPSSVLRWLEENDYDQPEGTGPLLNYYAVNNHVFVAVKLQKDSESGDIQPLILKYEMPGGEGGETDPTDAARRAIACVPIQLTRVAATENMPIQVYILGEARAVPLNFVEIELDDSQVDWVTCLNNGFCYDADYRRRFDQAASQLVNHSFVTEYAGPSGDVMEAAVVLPVTAADIATCEAYFDCFQRYRFMLPNLPLVDTIFEDYQTSAGSSNNFDAAGLAQELDQKVFQPAIEAQDFVDGFSYLTRLYARLSPNSMTKDPFFAFKRELPTVDNVHRATAVPLCSDGEKPNALIIAVHNGADSVTIPAELDCGFWRATQPMVVASPDVSPARQLASWGFAGDTGVVVFRSDDGSFDQQAVEEAVLFGDTLVMNQTIPDYTASESSSATLLRWIHFLLHCGVAFWTMTGLVSM